VATESRDTAVLSRDTSRDAEDVQVEAWRTMTPARKLEVAVSASAAARELARAGIRDRHPGASETEVTMRLALLTLGEDLARRVYPELRSANGFSRP